MKSIPIASPANNENPPTAIAFFTLNLLAFFMHQIFELVDGLYQQVRTFFSSRRAFWDEVRSAFRPLTENCCLLSSCIDVPVSGGAGCWHEWATRNS